ncbi:MAG: small, acid-soluble spore protein, alpha/beta type [Clostridiales bacterium]|nr:small, acid-soluble spore protein, alpha/beta type [Clostridiales bacterium]
MSKHRGVMSEKLKEDIAREMGVYNTVAHEGWGPVSSRDCGNMVRKAIERASRETAGK